MSTEENKQLLAQIQQLTSQLQALGGLFAESNKYQSANNSREILRLTNKLAKTYDDVRIYQSHEDIGPGMNVTPGSKIDYAKQAFNVVRKMKTESEYQQFLSLARYAENDESIWDTYLEELKTLAKLKRMEF